MMTDQNHLTSFVASIRERAEQERSEILAESEKVRQEQLDAERRLLAQEREQALRDARAEAQRETGRMLSEAVRSSAAAVSEKQQAIREFVFDKVESRLLAFVSSEEYMLFLQRSAERIVAALSSGDLCVYLSTRDFASADTFMPMFPAGTEFYEDATIRLGGFRAHTADGKRIADDTLDALLKEQKRRFAETAGLDV